MSIFFDRQLYARIDPAHKQLFIAWHPAYQLLAVASAREAAGHVTICANQAGFSGESNIEPILTKPVHPASLQWHPVKRYLAVGWSNGHLSVYNEADQGQESIVEVCTNAISHLQWSSNGSRLCAIDTTGHCVVLRLEGTGSLGGTPMAVHQLRGAPVTALLLIPKNRAALQKQKSVTTDSPDAALESFTQKRAGLFRSGGEGAQESTAYYVSTSDGTIYNIDDRAALQECLQQPRRVLNLLIYGERRVLLSLTDDLTLTQFSVAGDYALHELINVKLSGRSRDADMIWLMRGVLALNTREAVVRLWNLDTEENELLVLRGDRGYSTNDSIACMSYSENTEILACGTEQGAVALFRHQLSADPENSWRLQGPLAVLKKVLQVRWCPNGPLLAVLTDENVVIVQQQKICAAFNEKVAAVQLSADAVLVTWVDTRDTTVVSRVEGLPTVQVLGVCATHLLLGNTAGRLVVMQTTTGVASMTIGSIAANITIPPVIFNELVFLVDAAGTLVVYDLTGNVKQNVGMPAEEGVCVNLTSSRHFLAVGTSNGFIRVYDASKSEVRPHFHAKHVASSVPNFESFESIAVNVVGSRVSFIANTKDGSIDTKLYVWDAENDSVMYFNFTNGTNDQTEFEVHTAGSTRGAALQGLSAFFSPALRHPIAHAWDAAEPRYLVCQARQPGTAATTTPSTGHGRRSVATRPTGGAVVQSDCLVASFFVTTEHGILLNEVFPASDVIDTLLGVELPYLYFSRKPDDTKPTTSALEDSEQEASPFDLLGDVERRISHAVVQRTTRDFIGLEDSDEDMRKAMIDFSFYVTVGNMDEAFKAIKLIKSESVWEHMATMCVKTGRTDVAAVCLGNMGAAREARALREAMRTYPGQHQVHLAVLAAQLGMLDDAERLLSSADRYDLLNRFYQASNNWKRAIDLAQGHDRVHLRNTFYAYAKYLESIGAYQGAIDHFERSSTNRFEVPRMLFDNPAILEQYVSKTNDPYIQKWWAQYLESLGEVDQALRYYEAANDNVSIVRLHCFVGNLDKAVEIARTCADKAACYHVARQLEDAGRVQEAVELFAKAGAYSSAIKMCKEHGLEDQIAQLALMSSEADMIEAARFYEHKAGQTDKAVMLYHRAGLFGRALDLAFRTEQFSSLDLIASDLNTSSDPRVLERCAEFFAKNQQYDKAVQLLALAKRYSEGIQLCANKNVAISEKVAEALTPTKDSIPDTMERNQLLVQLADCCMQQRLYLVAAKKYTQAGHKTDAMKALIQSGDSAAVVRFANRAGAKESKLQIMAANYLQTADWRDHVGAIKKFYKNAGAWDSIGHFYDAVAMAEVDDSHDYATALSLLKEADKVLAEAHGPDGGEKVRVKRDELKKKGEKMQKFVDAKKLYDNDPAESLKRLQDMLHEKRMNDCVRAGDIVAVLVDHNMRKDNVKRAQSFVDELRSLVHGVELSHYIKEEHLIQLVGGQQQPKSGRPKTALDEIIPEAAALRRDAGNDWLD